MKSELLYPWESLMTIVLSMLKWRINFLIIPWGVITFTFFLTFIFITDFNIFIINYISKKLNDLN